MAKPMNLLMLSGALLAGLSGCGGVERPETVPVTGAVLYNGQPVAGASVSFWGPNAARAATGVTDAEGKFTLSMFDVNDGAIPGENTVTVSKQEANAKPAASPEDMLNDPTALTGNYQQNQGDGAADKKPLIPAKYGDKSSTPLKVTVADSEEGRNHILQLAD